MSRQYTSNGISTAHLTMICCYLTINCEMFSRNGSHDSCRQFYLIACKVLLLGTTSEAYSLEGYIVLYTTVFFIEVTFHGDHLSWDLMTTCHV